MKKNLRKYLLISITVIFLLTIGLTISYFVSEPASDESDVIDLLTSSDAVLEFVNDNSLSIDANMSNFTEVSGNLFSTATSTVTLSYTDKTAAIYNVYFYIAYNDFVYTQDEDTPELILKITSPDDTEITEISGLDYVTSGDVSGFDITTAYGLFEIDINYLISLSASGEIEQEWEFTLYFINLDANQNANAGKTFDGEVQMTQGSYSYLLSELILIDNYYDETGEVGNLATSIAYIESKDTPDFTVTAETDEGLFVTEDNYGDSYYFRGDVEDNYVEFADMLWRIVRIDGEDNIKLMLFNTSANGTNYSSIGYLTFNENYDDPSYSDYNVSTVKTFVDDWYESNLETDYESYLTKSSYCVDMEVQSYSTSNSIYYGAFDRLVGENWDASDATVPSLKCDSNIEGVTEYSYYVGLISADEVSFAGGTYYSENYSYYLYTGTWYWSGSAFCYDFFNAYSFVVDYDGWVYGGWVGNESNVFPAVSLSSSTLCLEGDGSIENPYKIVM